MHGEITSEKMAMGYFFDGKVTMFVGTHTHVPTSDHRILEKGTAYQTDIGMCGDYNSVIGMNRDNSLKNFFKDPSGKEGVPFREIRLDPPMPWQDIHHEAQAQTKKCIALAPSPNHASWFGVCIHGVNSYHLNYNLIQSLKYLILLWEVLLLIGL